MTALAQRIVAAAVLTLGIVAMMSTDIAAQATTPTHVAVVNYQRLMRDSIAAQNVREQIELQRQAYQGEINKREQELRETDQELVRQRAILSPDAFAQKRREFETQVAAVQRAVQTRTQELDKARAYGLQQVQKTVGLIVAELAQERGIELVLLQQGQIVFAEKALNISDEVLKRLNERLTTVEVPLNQN